MSRIGALAREQQARSGSVEAFLDYATIQKYGLHQFRPDEGDHFLRIFPYDPEAFYGFKLEIHYRIGPDGEAVLCPRRMLNKPCVICRTYGQISRSGQTDSPLLRGLKLGAPKYLFYVQDMRNPTTEAEGIKFYIAPYTIYEGIVDFTRDPRTGEVVDPFGPVDSQGRLLPANRFCFKRIGTTWMNTKYCAFRLEPEKVAPDPEIYRDLPHPRELLRFHSSEELEELFDVEAVEARMLEHEAGSEEPAEDTVPGRRPPEGPYEFGGRGRELAPPREPEVGLRSRPGVSERPPERTGTKRAADLGGEDNPPERGDHRYGGSSERVGSEGVGDRPGTPADGIRDRLESLRRRHAGGTQR